MEFTRSEVAKYYRARVPVSNSVVRNGGDHVRSIKGSVIL